jgi:squalene-hopene/tetraprenyl-beta-curcumene cyclase
MKALLLTCLAGALFAADPAATWDAKSAAAYMDGRMDWWMTWKTAARDHDTFCVSCHTVAPYAMGRPALRSALGEREPSVSERKLIENVERRVRVWQQVEPYYPDATRGVPKTRESRGTEAILNALILRRYHSPDLPRALRNMWAEQLTEGDDRGSFPWLQFHNAPWEGDSQYYGAALAAIAAGSDAPPAPGKKLIDYLLRERDKQAPVNRVMLLWASDEMPGLLAFAGRDSIIRETLAFQLPDGGFSLATLVPGWKRQDGTPLETAADGYATGLIAFVLEQSGFPRGRMELQRSLAWLAGHQRPADGRWLAYSLNKRRDFDSDVGKFMSDAGTAYAVMALEHANMAGAR